MASSLTKDSASSGEKTFFGHPRGLATLFMTEMWERFSYYGMRALLPLYLIAPGGLDMNPATATAIYSVYLSLVYLLAMPGGWFGDRVWGPRKTVAIAGGVIMAGHLVLALPWEGTFFAGLGLVAIGSGLLKSNISTMVGHLYDGPDDPRRDGGFTIFYMGINMGAFAAPLVIGTVGENVNWHLGFALAALGMGLGVLQFLLGTKHLDEKSLIVPKPLSKDERASTLRKSMIWLGIAAVFYIGTVVTGVYTLNWLLVPITIAGLVIPVMVLARIKRDKEPQRGRAVEDVRLHLVLRGRRHLLDDLRPGRLDAGDLRRVLGREQRLRLGLPGLLVPVGQPGPDHGARPGLRRLLAGAEPARQGAEHDRQVQLRSRAGRRLVLRLPDAADHRG